MKFNTSSINSYSELMELTNNGKYKDVMSGIWCRARGYYSVDIYCNDKGLENVIAFTRYDGGTVSHFAIHYGTE